MSIEKNNATYLILGRSYSDSILNNYSNILFLGKWCFEFNNYKEQFLIGATKEEKAELDKRFADGYIKRQQYETELASLRQNAISKLTEDEKALFHRQDYSPYRQNIHSNLHYKF